MEEINHKIVASVAKAVVLWTGYKVRMFPQRDDAAVMQLFSVDEATEVLNLLKRLEVDFYKSKAYQTAPNLAVVAELAIKDFITLYPILPAVIAEAFAWCYTYDYK